VGGILVHYAFDLSSPISSPTAPSPAADACALIPNQLTILVTVVIFLFSVGLILATRGRLA
jgi:hypothetical protein